MKLIKNIQKILKSITPSTYFLLSLTISVFVAAIIYVQMSKENFDVTKMPKRKVLFFKMKGCGFCDKVKPNWDTVKRNFNENKEQVQLEEIDYNEQPDQADKYGITSFPTFVIIKDGNVLRKESGYKSLEDLKKFVIFGKTD
jgi:thioredoxin 1